MTAPTQAQPTLWSRSLSWIADHARGLTIANLLAQGGIIVTGGLVRLTGSGLGCSTAPQCEPGKFLPDLSDLSINTAIEFSNRMLTIAVGIIALVAAVAVWRTRKDLRLLGLAPLFGVAVQAVLGAFTVNLDLDAIIVAAHMWVSVALVSLSTVLALRYRRAPAREGRPFLALRGAVVVVGGIAVVLGTLTTASGPHSGDKDVTTRLGLDLEAITRAHSMTVWLFIVLLALTIWQLRADRSQGTVNEVRRAWAVLVAVVVAQGLIGYTQYILGLPVPVVALHLVGVAFFTAAVTAFYYLTRPVTNR